MVAGHPTIARILQCIPFTYLVGCARQAFIGENIITKGYGFYTAIFWIITIILYIWGNHIFKKTKKDFADVL